MIHVGFYQEPVASDLKSLYNDCFIMNTPLTRWYLTPFVCDLDVLVLG